MQVGEADGRVDSKSHFCDLKEIILNISDFTSENWMCHRQLPLSRIASFYMLMRERVSTDALVALQGCIARYKEM